MLLSRQLFVGRYEREEQERGAQSQREGERRVPGSCQDVATPFGHHQPVGQGLNNPAHHQLPQDAPRLS